MLPLLLSKLFWTLRARSRRSRGQPRRQGAHPKAKLINVALQGGGAHGAFTWGVLDQLLADGRIAIDGISGASAGAVNAVMLADGLARGGPGAAREQLAEFWRAASIAGNLPAPQRAVVERLFSFASREDAAAPWIGPLSRVMSPYDLNPLNINPLKDLIERFADFDRIRRDTGRPLFVTATDVRNGDVRVFTRAEITAEAVMASACIPHMFRAVEIDGVPYWDGGYSGNPVLSPFLQTTSTEDVLIVQINPLERRKLPASVRDIVNRAHEITFNASLLVELRHLGFVNSLIDQGRLPRGFGPRDYRRIRLHRIVLDDFGDTFDARSRLDTDFAFFEMLHKLGQRAARRFLDSHVNDIGRRSTIDLDAPVEAKVA